MHLVCPLGQHEEMLGSNLQWTPGWVLRISSDGDDRRIFGGLKFSIPGFFWEGKFGKYFFGGLI